VNDDPNDLLTLDALPMRLFDLAAAPYVVHPWEA